MSAAEVVKATPGKWEWREIAPDDPTWGACEIWSDASEEPVATMVIGTGNAKHIVDCVNSARHLADEVERLKRIMSSLVDADKAYDAAREAWGGEQYESDDYGVHGSTFYRCLACERESGAGVLNSGVPHESDCLVAALEVAEDRRIAAIDVALAEQQP